MGPSQRVSRAVSNIAAAPTIIFVFAHPTSTLSLQTMASSSTVDAEPSGSKASTKKQKSAKTPDPVQPKSNEMIIDSESEESDEEESVDSDDDIEKILPKKKDSKAAGPSSRGQKLP